MRADMLIADVHSNHELLNKILKTDYKGWMSSIYDLKNGSFIWMVCLDGKVRKGWRNEKKKDEIIEQYEGGKPYPTNIRMGLDHELRYVFEKVKSYGVKRYIFRGVYKLVEGKDEYRRLSKISNDTDIFSL